MRPPTHKYTISGEPPAKLDKVVRQTTQQAELQIRMQDTLEKRNWFISLAFLLSGGLGENVENCEFVCKTP